ncbi:hypothetical protein [Burkholderia stagnalis]|uniref:Lysozyme inhibitor n=1 Tax=Burkholderia stagnalis TaxID=1503054 RepID=A0A6L3N1V3_9BURK|nr:hypothetical protein [Burkholderia stagnalis]KAB0640111.1 hypothetical protein F7R25_05450 [Burkholderia stagnalis]
MNVYRAVAVAILSLAPMVAAHAEGMCTEKEVVIFNCELEKTIASLCQSTESGTLTYRNGNGGKIGLQISDSKRIKKVFYFSNIPYAGGGEAHIGFSRLGYTYYLYDKTIRSDEGSTFSAGIVVYRGEKKISNISCNNNASIRERAYQEIAREKYRSIDAR